MTRTMMIEDSARSHLRITTQLVVASKYPYLPSHSQSTGQRASYTSLTSSSSTCVRRRPRSRLPGEWVAVASELALAKVPSTGLFPRPIYSILSRLLSVYHSLFLFIHLFSLCHSFAASSHLLEPVIPGQTPSARLLLFACLSREQPAISIHHHRHLGPPRDTLVQQLTPQQNFSKSKAFHSSTMERLCQALMAMALVVPALAVPDAIMPTALQQQPLNQHPIREAHHHPHHTHHTTPRHTAHSTPHSTLPIEARSEELRHARHRPRDHGPTMAQRPIHQPRITPAPILGPAFPPPPDCDSWPLPSDCDSWTLPWPTSSDGPGDGDGDDSSTSTGANSPAATPAWTTVMLSSPLDLSERVLDTHSYDCYPGDRQCHASLSYISFCNDDHHWIKYSDCPEGWFCHRLNLDCVPEVPVSIESISLPQGVKANAGKCKYGDRRCSTQFNRVDLCNRDKEWVTYHDCRLSERCDGTLLECTPLVGVPAPPSPSSFMDSDDVVVILPDGNYTTRTDSDGVIIIVPGDKDTTPI
ncbi:hypothetical protein F4808DRAFT_424338 [Astrocystis sublimbata]|nr:hypothetical protein F4808DRAFT_424338 [Astrocystis sublimbata]